MKTLPTVFTVALTFAMPLAGLAQNARQLEPNERLTNIKGVTTFAPPPAGFSPINASDADLQLYGFPPRPNKGSDADAYAGWERAMTAFKTRVTPTLEQTAIFHGPARGKGKNGKPALGADGAYESYNWSGYANTGGAAGYTANSFYYLYANYIVPPAQQAFGACTGGWDYSSSWVGLDGFDNDDVMQAGFEADAYCSGGTKSTYYSFWYEWYPFSEVRISSLAISPGQEVEVEVWTVSKTQAYAYIEDYQDGSSTTIGFTAPSGTTLSGDSAEWIVERPDVGGSLATLTNYIADPFWHTYAYTFNGILYQISGVTADSIVMLDNSSNPISHPYQIGGSSFVALTEGSAY
jgi:hypothetical protein